MKKYWEIMVSEDIAEACEDAADLLEGHWARGHWYEYCDGYYADGDETEWVESEETWTYCIEGALAAAVGLDFRDMDGESQERSLLLACPVYSAVVETINIRMEREGLEGGICMGELPTWNDSDDTGCSGEQEALDVLRETAKRVRGVPA